MSPSSSNPTAAARRALVTGATGFVGSHVASFLLEKGYNVRILARPGSDRRNIPDARDVEIFEGDLRDASSVARAVAGCQEIFHVAADYRFWARDPGELYASNVEGTRHLLDAAIKSGVEKFVHTSTVGTIGLANQPTPCDENTPFDPRQWGSPYKDSKKQAELLALSYLSRGLPVVVVNPSTPIGPRDRKPTPTGRIIVDFMRGKMPAYVHTGLNFVHVRDVAEGHWLAARNGRVGERYILGNENLSMIQFLRLLSSLTGQKPPAIRIPYRLAHLVGAASTAYADWVTHREPAVALDAVKMSRRFMFFDPSKAVRELGLPQRPVKEAAQDALDWFAAEGYFNPRGVS